jgi:hypothetical protein
LLMRQAGQSCSGASAGSGAPHWGQEEEMEVMEEREWFP